MHTVNQWASGTALFFLFCCLLFYFCSSAKWQKEEEDLVGFCIVVVFCLCILGSFTFEMIFSFLLSSYWYGFQNNIYVSFELSFQFIVSLWSDFSSHICLWSKHDPQIFCKKSGLQHHPKLIHSHLLQLISSVKPYQVVDISQNLLMWCTM